MILRLFANEYAEMITKECRRLLEENGPKIRATPIADDAGAMVFLDTIWDPFINFLSSSIP
jgi:hypothetical protein